MGLLPTDELPTFPLIGPWFYHPSLADDPGFISVCILTAPHDYPCTLPPLTTIIATVLSYYYHGFSMTIDSLNDNRPLRGGFICYFWIYLNLSHRISSIDRHETTLASPDLRRFFHLTYIGTLLLVLTARRRWAIETN